ncbi:thiamine pyrophosphate-dependent dehydrogenase E1 component subunit alpha [Mycoplasma tauri]|uniref:2-oxoisovalerate dehydrogenase subunit alpha n=1 Tax=Mycoplasma tauri TaxID=547987 RepID=A0A953T3M9_9MOLU|nr:thiamine pyrophosphate-dependent dehydrogenase E1 component subunit alpha [Mycoplasma tauri]MBZ4195253.1 thiamine pyrophosphate-dependent dehydrogenase E1 component subunit alpha [Mycoplasma tauri]MBZ4203650.1 thiamine pyrophosphate-dependent dehydrogenase E1 component subunit alpha [Mycoplasma tauri]MBZ4204184.1 thiamine pyrophosphate-dependent dehydrogenase E1 component subunit alpha [Mycoplasma tauri]MBZ4212582.1 thiamine pyrophosphate-dependent dehydrogenase E1 component subunit alpha [M
MKFKYIKPGLVMSDPNEMIRVLDIDGNLIDKNFQSSASRDDLLAMYTNIIRSRQWDLYALTLQKTGRLGTFAPALGEEAALTAIGFAMRKDDWFTPHYRVLSTQLARGVPMEKVYLYWHGSEQGSAYKEGTNVLPAQIVIASQISIGAGVASALKAQGNGAIATTIIGNGGTNEGEFHEGINLASVRNWPLAIVIMNNQWAISVPEHNSYKVKTLSQRAASYDIPGIRVDGNDLLAAYESIKEVYEYIRQGNGPVLVEFVTWRQGQHTTSDDPRVYRSKELEQEKEKWEPIHRIEKYLFDNGILTEELKAKIAEDAQAEAKAAYEASLVSLKNEGFEDIYKYTYETLPTELVEQMEANKRFEK